jgi:hypothetical protein
VIKLCPYCVRDFDSRGLLSHISRMHWRQVQLKFAYNPIVWMTLWVEYGNAPRFQHLALPAPNPLTVYSTRPLGKMAKPIPEHRRPKGYTLGYGYSRPADALAGQHRFNRPIY